MTENENSLSAIFDSKKSETTPLECHSDSVIQRQFHLLNQGENGAARLFSDPENVSFAIG